MDLEEMAEEAPGASADQVEANEPRSEPAVAQDDIGRCVRPWTEETFVLAQVAEVEERVQATSSSFTTHELARKRSSLVASSRAVSKHRSLLLGLGGQGLVGL